MRIQEQKILGDVGLVKHPELLQWEVQLSIMHGVTTRGGALKNIKRKRESQVRSKLSFREVRKSFNQYSTLDEAMHSIPVR